MLASVLMVGITVPFALSAWSLWQVGLGPLDVQTLQRIAAAGGDANAVDAFTLPLTREAARFWFLLAAAVMAGLCLWTNLLALGVGIRRETARHGAIMTFLLFALIAVPHGLGGWFVQPRPAGLGSASVAAVGTAAVVWLLATRQVADDVARATFYRERRGRVPDGRDGHEDGRPDPPVLAA